VSSRQPPQQPPPDLEEISRTVGEAARQAQRILQTFLQRHRDAQDDGYSVLDPGVVLRTLHRAALGVLADPERLIERQASVLRDCVSLWESAARRMIGQEGETLAQPVPGDKRFKEALWDSHPLFDLIKQTYLVTTRHLQSAVQQAQGLDDATARRAAFYTRQLVDAIAPTNFALSNPQVLEKTLQTGGRNLLDGLQNLLDDLERGGGRLRISMTDENAFELGRNVAATPGKVVFQNELMQLVQYDPTTESVYRRPLLIVPPWINKFYVLDLRPKSSFVRWAVAQGHTVFLISWVNPDEALADKSFEDYMVEGVLAALDAIARATGTTEVKALGYCLGGTLLASTLAWQAATGDRRIRAATFLTTMVDFAEPGELGVFIDDEQLALVESHMQRTGYFDGAHMADAFNLLRANDLIWSFVVNNYLLGKEPFPFDLLYWNADSTRMPREMHSFYLRNMYQHNLLREPGGIRLLGVPIDLRRIDVPAYVLATREDHIAPWRSTYAATGLYAGPVRFVLGWSGHIAGVINPPVASKYGYNVGRELAAEPDEWLAVSEQHAGSWWLDWKRWVSRYNGKKIAARIPGAGGLSVIEDAPGSYVKVHAGA
jgi:polyhydroxyalkanoate synthase